MTNGFRAAFSACYLLTNGVFAARFKVVSQDLGNAFSLGHV